MVTGTFTVPEIKLPENHDPDETYHTVSAWMGLDGFNCPGYLRVGMGLHLSKEGGVSYSLKYSMSEYLGDEIRSARPSPGDQFRFNVSVGTDSVTGNFDTGIGWIDIENLNTGEVHNLNLNNANHLCLNTVNWYLERFDIRSTDFLKPIPGFGKMIWSDTYAEMICGDRVDPRESSILDLDDGFTLTKAEVTEYSVTIYYNRLQ